MKKTFPITDETARCYVCNKTKPVADMQDCSNGVYRCKGHRTKKILDAVPKEKRGKVWEITIPSVTITIREV